MKVLDLLKQVTLKDIIAGVLGIAVVYLIFMNVQTTNVKDKLKQDNSNLTIELAQHHLDIKNLTNQVDSLNKVYKQLLTIKSKTITNYETKIKEIHDARIISNDSVSRYISAKIHNQY